MDMIDPVKLVTLEQIDDLIFRGITPKAHWGRVFGGQVIAQGLAAAYETVEDRFCHSLHAYFLRAGDPDIPIIFHIDAARNGGSFSSRRVVAIQRGQQILNMAVSFKIAEKGFEHYRTMPDVPPPEDLPSGKEIRQAYLDKVPEGAKNLFRNILPIEERPVNPRDLMHPQPDNEKSKLWFRLNLHGEHSLDSAMMKHALLAYVSDVSLLQAATRKHDVNPYLPNVQAASLDHALWFHHDFDIEDWFLYETDSPAASGGTGLNLGSIFARNGQHVCSTVQEGLVRVKPEKS